MNSNLEEIYLEAEADIRNSNYAEAFKKYETLLYDEPGNAPILNSLGWLYKTQLDNFEKAENYFKAAIKSEPLYPHPYFHLASLYADMEKFDDLKQHLENCLRVPTIEKSWVFAKFGLVEELGLHFEEAISFYEKAILISCIKEKIADYKLDIERCREKLGMSGRHSDLIKKKRGFFNNVFK